MIRKIFSFLDTQNKLFSGFENSVVYYIHNHFRLSNYQMLFIIWIKGIWTGLLLALIFHYFVSH